MIAAHDGLGHGGTNTTRTLLNKHFTWPGLSTDFKNHIQACPKCLKHTKSGGHKVPLMQPELICQRGEKIAVDIVGPLPTSKQKYRFILPSMEMATSYPFAVPLRNYTLEETAKAILPIISKGSNFLSVTLNHLYKKFGISKIKTSAYHSQSNGKLERFHSTMKTMLSKCIDAKQDWPMALDLVLYFCRNLPQSRHGFIPQELLFIKPTPYILSTLKSFWSSATSNNLNLPFFISELDTILSCQLHHVKQSLAAKNVQHRLKHESQMVIDFKPGDTDFKRNPGFNKCLDASWDGPFVVCDIIPPVNCSIRQHGSKQKPKVVHISQLKQSLSINRAIIIPTEDVDAFSFPTNTPQPIPLSVSQQSQLQHVLDSFPTVFTDSPGLTSLVEHSISLTSSIPVWSPPYTIPIHAHQAAFREEIEKLISLGIIEPSTSKYSSSPMPITKKEGGIRIVRY